MADEYKGARSSWISEPVDTQMPEVNFDGLTAGYDMTARLAKSVGEGARGGAHGAARIGRAGRQVGRAMRRHPYLTAGVAAVGVAAGMGL